MVLGSPHGSSRNAHNAAEVSQACYFVSELEERAAELAQSIEALRRSEPLRPADVRARAGIRHAELCEVQRQITALRMRFQLARTPDREGTPDV